ncbi:Transient receptor potential cation channel [Fragilaria crotonensis]|nr:Transient receptor potential cation channel [Fragilaria crotonensis]
MNHQGNNVDHQVVVRHPLHQIRRDVASGSLNPLARDSCGQNLLHVAVSKYSLVMIHYLGTEWGGNRKELMNAVDRQGKTALHVAFSDESPNLKVVEYLLDLFRAIEVVGLCSSESLLHVAIRRNVVELVKLLVSRAVRGRAYPLTLLGSRDGDGRTPLLFACTLTEDKNVRKRLDIVRYLVKLERPNGLDSQLSQPRDKNGRTALHLACASYQCFELVTELVKNYSDDVEVQDSTNMRPLHVAVSYAASVNGKADSLRIVRFLLTQVGADVNAKDGKGWTPLHYACQAIRSFGAELIRLLVEYGAETESGDKVGRTPLHVATLSGNHNLIAHLVEKVCATVDLRDNEGNTSLHVACTSGNFVVARYLLNQCANADAENVHKQRPIHIACSNLQYEFLRLIVDRYGANVNVADRYRQTPLHKACLSNIGISNAHAGANVVRFLLDKGAGVDVRDKYGKPPLLYAVSSDNIDGARLLISHGANILCKDKFQNNVLHVARSADMAKLLIEDTSTSANARGTAYTLLTSTNSKGETPIETVHRVVLNGGYLSDGLKLLHYFRSFLELQVAVDPRQQRKNKRKRRRFEACSQLNPNLSAFQLHYVTRMCDLLGRSELAEDLKFHVLGFLSPLDLMNG